MPVLSIEATVLLPVFHQALRSSQHKNRSKLDKNPVTELALSNAPLQPLHRAFRGCWCMARAKVVAMEKRPLLTQPSASEGQWQWRGLPGLSVGWAGPYTPSVEAEREARPRPAPCLPDKTQQLEGSCLHLPRKGCSYQLVYSTAHLPLPQSPH